MKKMEERLKKEHVHLAKEKDSQHLITMMQDIESEVERVKLEEAQRNADKAQAILMSAEERRRT